MTKIGNIRLESLKLENFKNIANGEIYFNENKKLERGIYDEDEFSNLLCIYGQNGSGKTACLNAIRLLQHLLSGSPLLPEHFDYIRYGTDHLSLEAAFLLENGNYKCYIEYKVTLKRDTISRIEKESISYSNFEPNGRKTNIFSFEYPDTITKSFLDKLERKMAQPYSYIAAMETSTRISNCIPVSALFNPKLLGLSLKSTGLGHEEKMVIESLHHFAVFRLAIYSINYFENNERLGIRIRIKNEGKTGSDATCGDLFVPFKPFKLSKKDYASFLEVIGRINKVIPSIIPGYQVRVNELYSADIQAVIDGVDFVLMSDRNGVIVPLAYESNGIKKIISLISGMIEAYSNEGHLLVVDELDSGIFEYLLGEIAYAFDNFSKGQLIFTCHNMRVLEKVSYRNSFFTTLNPNRVFTKLTNVKESNNLRDLYYKYIANGYKDGIKLYDMVDTASLIYALDTEAGE